LNAKFESEEKVKEVLDVLYRRCTTEGKEQEGCEDLNNEEQN
jgi:hypothetical protein